ncbi:MAG: DNA-protecting protein DprA [Bdellovibrionales bacterium]|nr:DNA-protecting protein DprA [Oligoflexia bacterium]
MKLTRISPLELSAFKTFDRYRTPAHLDVQTRDGDYSWLEELPDIGLAIVGTRHPQKRSIELLEKTISDLKHTRMVIISGFARGIDSYAHEFAIQNGLRTLAFLGCGIHQDYPRENHALRRKILDAGGAVISQFANDAIPLARNFHDRNGLIAGFAKATWVVEAAEVSGTLNTASWAQRFNRDLYATSCFPLDHYYQGNVKLLSEKETNKYPVARSFFHVGSFGATWSDFNTSGLIQDCLPFTRAPKTEIQKWVLKLKADTGECSVQNLMNYATTQGQTLGRFYLQFEKEMEAGYLRQDSSGRVDVLL